MSDEVVKFASINFSIEFLSVHRFEQDQYDKVPMFIFGDFNFRLDINLLVQVRNRSWGGERKCCEMLYQSQSRKIFIQVP